MTYAIAIPEPCNEAWDEMRAEDNGRHCFKCSKTVVDFTTWNEQDIITYLQEHSSKQVCGRFSPEHVTQPPNADFVYSITKSTLPFYKKIAAILLVAFGLVEISGSSVAYAQQHNPKNNSSNQVAAKANVTMGKPVAPKNHDHPQNKKHMLHKKNKRQVPMLAPNEEQRPIGGAPMIYEVPEADTTRK